MPVPPKPSLYIVYKIAANAPPLDVKDIQLLGGSKVKPGLASLAGNPSVVNGYLKPLLESAMKIAPTDKHVSTPIFLFARAGMRLLTKHQSDAIMKEVKEVMIKQNVLLLLTLKQMQR